MRKLKVLLLMVLSAFSLFFTSCSKGEEESILKLNYETKELFVNQSFKLQLTKDGIILTSDVTFSSSDVNVASVDNSGLVMGLKNGESTISAKYNDKVTSCNVVVKEKEVIALSKSKLVLDLGQTETISLNKNDTPITSGVNWETLDSEIAVINNGVVKPVAIGETTIIAKYLDKAYSLEVVITKPFTEFGKYVAHRSVPEMGDVLFNFELMLNSDLSYEYKRLDAYSSDETLDLTGEVVSTGTYTSKAGVITLMDESKDLSIVLNINNENLKSDGEITVGKGYKSELTFAISK